MDLAQQESQLMFFYNRHVRVDDIIVTVEFVTPSLDLAYQRNEVGDVTQLEIHGSD